MFTIREVIGYNGVMTFKANYQGHEGIRLGIGILSEDKVLDVETFESELNGIEWKGSLELFCAEVSKQIQEDLLPLGSLVLGLSQTPELYASVVTGEVKQDFDVKQEMFVLLGIK